jgi:hypothetical protein
MGEAGLGRGVQVTQQSANALAAKLGPQVSAAIAAGDTAALNAATAQLRSVVKQLEQQVDSPTVPPRLAAWAHASIYQVCSVLLRMLRVRCVAWASDTFPYHHIIGRTAGMETVMSARSIA